MMVGYETLKKNRKKIAEEDGGRSGTIKKRYPFFMRNSLSSPIILLCTFLLFLGISYFPKSPNQITTLKVNFQDAGTTPPTGWLVDFGEPFGLRKSFYQGKGYSYGWIKKSDKTPLDLTKNGFKRDFSSDVSLATFVAMQPIDAETGGQNLEDAVWEAQIRNGNYDVTVTVGDAGNTNSRHCINVEGVSTIANFVPIAGEKFKSATITITVADGNLTIDAVGGVNTKLNAVTINPSVAKRPSITTVNPDNTADFVNENSSVTTNVILLPNGRINTASLTPSSVYLKEEANGSIVPATVIANADGDEITLKPSSPLKPGTIYRFTVTSKVKDRTDSSFIPYSSTFTTTSVSSHSLLEVGFEKVALPTTTGQHSTLTFGPDGKLYALTVDGIIKRFEINADGTLQQPELLYSLQDASGRRTKRLAIGLVFDPSSTASNLIAWVTNHSFTFQNGPNWDGKITRLSGPKLEKVQDAVVNLPRSTKDHLTNSMVFGADGAMYFAQGSNTSMGSADNIWGTREENLLSGAILRLDLSRLKSLPLNVKTPDGGGNYNPYSPAAPLTIFASGIRNAYDLVWHSNGYLYVPTNGSAAGGNTPASKKGVLRIDGTRYNGPSVPALSFVQQTEKDFLFKVEKGGYYGHANPLRGEFVMNGGNPTPMTDPAEVTNYPIGTKPDVNWRGYSYDFHNNTSPNGVIEYRSNNFNGSLKGKLLVVRYSKHDDIMTLTPGGNKNDIITATEGYLIKGFSGFVDPLDIVEDTRNGNIYVSQFAGEGKVVLLRPQKDVPVVRK